MASGAGTGGYSTGQGQSVAGSVTGGVPAAGGAGYQGGGVGTGYAGGQPAGAYAGSMGEQGGPDVVDAAQETLGQVKDMAQETVGTVMQQAQEQVSARLTDTLDEAAIVLSEVADAVETVAQQLRQNNQPMLGEYANRAAHQVDRLSGYLEENDIEDMVFEVERFARRQPAIFLGSAFTLGLLAVRFLKSSAPRARPGYQPRRMNPARVTRPRLSRPTAAYQTAGYETPAYRPAGQGSTTIPHTYPAGGTTGQTGMTGAPRPAQQMPPEPRLGTERAPGASQPPTYNPGV